MNKKIIFSLLGISILFITGIAQEPSGNLPKNRVQIVTLLDTVYSTKLPPVEIKGGWINNLSDITTIGVNIVLRGTTIKIDSVKYYKNEPESNGQRIFETFRPVSVQAGDSVDKHRIDIVKLESKFPYTTKFHKKDSLVVYTDKGNLVFFPD